MDSALRLEATLSSFIDELRRLIEDKFDIEIFFKRVRTCDWDNSSYIEKYPKNCVGS
ncbi:hypothetical protein ACQKNS_02895 [Peribacillus sp. NPDC094092]|uniref:hypothetical protein n=1 Tax=Peribacillus sp. NPDC094092 TaxID=3390611 RepID=UPI003D080445